MAVGSFLFLKEQIEDIIIIIIERERERACVSLLGTTEVHDNTYQIKISFLTCVCARSRSLLLLCCALPFVAHTSE